jgi:hypothetical protein
MKMNMIHRLTSLGAVVDNNSEAVCETLLLGNELGSVHHVAKDSFVLLLSLG